MGCSNRPMSLIFSLIYQDLVMINTFCRKNTLFLLKEQTMQVLYWKNNDNNAIIL